MLGQIIAAHLDLPPDPQGHPGVAGSPDLSWLSGPLSAELSHWLLMNEERALIMLL